ncbi:putative 23S rRNA C2498 ribose 2'-O-ribose methyltransferase [Alcanivorax xiamenensis]|uniref:23S rRNA C2498 ribose 2'-O-ribose methyltransferase n=1 Tax=Alcanivorax xiamenensis TaxID=1177156 RepID=A0ABQ6YAP7_9GAMM|nr:putative 23S rRNA C2498 ribose 2'-O-ribose methyltransferase [Alcanivorax xiamenensis]
MAEQPHRYLALCRPGFESDLAAELSDRAADLGAAGYPQAQPDSGCVFWENLQGDPAPILESGLIFARTFYPLVAAFDDLPERDRIGALWPELKRNGPYTELYLEHADTNDRRELAGFLRGFRKALEPRLRKEGVLRANSSRRLHLYFDDSRHGYIGVSPSRLPLPEGGIQRLRLAPEAPGRSNAAFPRARPAGGAAHRGGPWRGARRLELAAGAPGHQGHRYRPWSPRYPPAGGIPGASRFRRRLHLAPGATGGPGGLRCGGQTGPHAIIDVEMADPGLGPDRLVQSEIADGAPLS